MHHHESLVASPLAHMLPSPLPVLPSWLLHSPGSQLWLFYAPLLQRSPGRSQPLFLQSVARFSSLPEKPGERERKADLHTPGIWNEPLRPLFFFFFFFFTDEWKIRPWFWQGGHSNQDTLVLSYNGGHASDSNSAIVWELIRPSAANVVISYLKHNVLWSN